MASAIINSGAYTSDAADAGTETVLGSGSADGAAVRSGGLLVLLSGVTHGDNDIAGREINTGGT